MTPKIRSIFPELGIMNGYAATATIRASRPSGEEEPYISRIDYWTYIDSVPKPTIMVIHDLDAPHPVGSWWGEVNANTHRALGCVGTITDGSIRDLDEMTNAGFKALARRLCVGHAHVTPVRWGCKVEVFGQTIQPGQLVHADKHGFLAIEPEVESQLLEAATFMDANECNTVIRAARESTGKTCEELLESLASAGAAFGAAAEDKFGAKGRGESR